VAVFNALWLCGWAFLWFETVKQIARGGDDVGSRFFMVGWLVVWTAGGGLAIWSLWVMLRPGRPESVRLENEALRYDPGRAPFNPWQRHNRWGWGLPAAPKPTPAAVVARSDIRSFELEQVGGRQRLYIDCGVGRLEIGTGLRKPEQEWLFAILRAWQTPNPSHGPRVN
jgi:hypothetical protein